MLLSGVQATSFATSFAFAITGVFRSISAVYQNPDYINAVWLREDAESEITHDRTALPHCSYEEGHTLNIGIIASEIALHAMSYLDCPCKRDVS